MFVWKMGSLSSNPLCHCRCSTWATGEGIKSVTNEVFVKCSFCGSISLQKLIPISQITSHVLGWIRGALLCSFFRGKMSSQTNWWPGKVQPSSSPSLISLGIVQSWADGFSCYLSCKDLVSKSLLIYKRKKQQQQQKKTLQIQMNTHTHTHYI